MNLPELRVAAAGGLHEGARRAPVVEPWVKLPEPLLEMLPTTVTAPKKSTLGLPQPLWSWRLWLEWNGPAIDSPQPYTTPALLHRLIATANRDHDSWVKRPRRAATEPRGSLMTERMLMKLLPYCPAVAGPPVRPPVFPA